MRRGTVLVSGATLGTIVALLIRTSSKDRCRGAALPRFRSRASRMGPPEDVLERYRRAAAV